MNTPIANSNAPRRRSFRVRIGSVLLLWLLCMAPLASWGLPTSKTDHLLFGDGPAWNADQFNLAQDLDERRERVAGADTDLNPIGASDQLRDLTGDPTARAEILRRYRLFTRQPDEMITMMALQSMNPRAWDFDPHLYQYGGAYIYMIGGALAFGSAVGFVSLSADAAQYLENPESFARFYLVARCVTLLFGVLLLLAVVRLARRAAGRRAGWIALALVAASPVFISSVLEAKPHLPSVCTLLWATLAALDYQARGRRRDALRLGLFSGLALGFVLTGAVAALVWPVLWLARTNDRKRATRHLLLAGLLAVGIYAISNPYVLYNLMFHREALGSNIGNSTAMYSVGSLAAGAGRVCELLIESVGLGAALFGLVGWAWLLRRFTVQTLIASAAVVTMLAIAVAIGAGKPAEFARFLLLPAIFLAISTAAWLAIVGTTRPFAALLATFVVLAISGAPRYLASFVADARLDQEARHIAARWIESEIDSTVAIGVTQEPAPYAVPPIDFAHRTIVLLPRTAPRSLEAALPQWLVLTADTEDASDGAWWQPSYELARAFSAEPLSLSPITWADKPVFVYRLAK